MKLLYIPIALLGITGLYLLYIGLKQERLRKHIKQHHFISHKEFEKNWILTRIGKRGICGYKYLDGPGCYVITIYEKRMADINHRGAHKNYENVYVGQSIKMCNRVHNHFNGRGNEDVYKDIRRRKHVYVKFIPCRKVELNRLERKLIEQYHATDSYNHTKGGGIVRYETQDRLPG